MYDASDVFDGAVEEIDEEGEGAKTKRRRCRVSLWMFVPTLLLVAKVIIKSSRRCSLSSGGSQSSAVHVWCALCTCLSLCCSSGGEEVERRAYADVRQLEAAATATRKLGGRRKLKALPAPPVKTAAGDNAAAAAAGGGGGGGGSAAAGGSATAGGGAVAEKMPLERSSGGSSSGGASAAQPGKGQASGGGGGGGLKGFFAVSRGRQIGECSG